MKNRMRVFIPKVAMNIKIAVAALSLVMIVSCGDDDGVLDPLIPDGQSNLRITSVDATADAVTLRNFGDAEIDITDYWFCFRRSYTPLEGLTITSGNLTLGENETVTFSITVNDEGSDISVYSSNSFTSSSALVDFMQFNGSFAANGREDVAVAKGIWTAGDFVEGASVFTYNGNGTETGVSQWSGDEVTTPTESSVRIVKVDALEDVVTLRNFGTTAEDISSYYFCNRKSYPALSSITPVSGNLTLDPNEEVQLPVTINDNSSDVSLYLNNNGFASAENMIDFMQYGEDVGASGRVDVAIEKGIWTAGEFVTGVSIFTYDGDGSQNGADQWTGNEGNVALESNVRIVNVDPTGDVVTLKNFGSESEDISAYFFCSRKSYAGLSTITPVSGDLTLDAGEEVELPLTINDVSSDVSIYFNNSGFADAGNMIDFMQYGEDVGESGRVSVAVEKGIWSTGNFISGIAPYSFTGTIEDNGVTFWIGSAVIRIVSINPDSEFLTIKNLGSSEMDISAYQLCLGPGNYNGVSNYTTVTGDFILSADEEVVIDLSSSNGNVNALPDQGGLGLFANSSFSSSSSDDIKDFVQWGAANQPRVGQAVTAGRWDSADNFVSGTAPFEFTGEHDDAGSTFWQ